MPGEEIGLFSPITIRGVTARNRLWISPMCQYSVTARDWRADRLAPGPPRQPCRRGGRRGHRRSDGSGGTRAHQRAGPGPLARGAGRGFRADHPLCSGPGRDPWRPAGPCRPQGGRRGRDRAQPAGLSWHGRTAGDGRCRSPRRGVGFRERRGARGPRRFSGRRDPHGPRIPAAPVPVAPVEPAHGRVRRQLREPRPLSPRGRGGRPGCLAARSAAVRADQRDRLGRRRLGHRGRAWSWRAAWARWASI